MATIKCKWSQYIISSRMVEVSRWGRYQKGIYIQKDIYNQRYIERIYEMIRK